MKPAKLLASPMLSKAERARLRQALEISKKPAELVSQKYRHALEMQRREEAMMAEADVADMLRCPNCGETKALDCASDTFTVCLKCDTRFPYER